MQLSTLKVEKYTHQDNYNNINTSTTNIYKKTAAARNSTTTATVKSVANQI